MFAFETLGIVTFAYTKTVAVDRGEMLGAAYLVVCSQDHIRLNAKQVQIISRS